MISADVDGGSGGGGDGFFAVLLLLPLAPLAVPLAAAAAAAASPCPLLFFFLAMLLVICCPSLRVTLEAWPEGAVARLARIIYTPRSGQPPPATRSRLRLSFAPHPPPTTTLLLVLCLPVRPQTPFELLLAATSTCPVRATWTNAALVRAASMARVRWPQPPLIVARIHMLPCISRKCGQALCPVSGQAFARAWPFIQTHVTITNSTPRLLVHAHPSIRGTSG